MKPLMEYAPFKIGERFEDEEGDVLEIVGEELYVWAVVDGKAVNRGPWDILAYEERAYTVKPLDRTTSPKPWRDMTDDEKAPILLAWADGKSIEWWDKYEGAWCDVEYGPQDWYELAYRIAPEDVRKEPREWWLNPFTLCASKTEKTGYVHVREVLE